LGPEGVKNSSTVLHFLPLALGFLGVAEAAPKGDGVNMAFVKAEAAADAFVLVDHIAPARLSVNRVDRTILDAFAAPVALDVDIDFRPGLNEIHKAV
jgi:hypothetical protein